MDFYFGSHIIYFDIRMTIVQFNVSINDDDIFEDDETFNLSINLSTLPNKVIIGSPSQTTVIIVDDDGKKIHDYVCMCS